MCDSDFDYTLRIEFERFSIDELSEVLKILYRGSSECFIDIELLADEVIRLQNVYQYSIRETEFSSLNKLIISTFEILKKISRFMFEPSSRIQIIYDNYQKYMHGVESPVASPVVSPKSSSEVKVPKIMKKVKRKKHRD